MTISINDTPVHRAELHATLSERWTLEVAYAGETVPTGKVTVLWGSAKFIGTVDPKHVGIFNGEVIARIVGGWGWSQELPATWYQSDRPGVHGKTIATKAAEAVGETLIDAPASTYRPLRVSYSRAKRTAAATLNDSLAPGVSWWTDFEGTTRVGIRAAPSSSARVVLLDYDPASKWAELDADDPANLLGATIPADTIRGIPALVINELFAWGNAEGFRFRASVAPVAEQGPSRLASALHGLVRSFAPELPALALRRANVVSQSGDGRVSLQQVDRGGEVSDFGREEGAVRHYAGSPGVSAEFDLRDGTTPETILAFARADQSDPFTFLSPPLGQPGHVPFRVAHEAISGIRFVGQSAGVVRVGATPTVPVALAPPVNSIKAALATLATSLSSAASIANVAAAGVALTTALSSIPTASATKLEAK